MNDYPIPPKKENSGDKSYRTADIAYDENLAQTAFKRVLSVIQGNGIDIKRVNLTKVDSYVLELFGSLHLILRHEIKQHDTAGHAGGGETISAGQLPIKIEKIHQDLGFDSVLCESIFNDITYGTSKGFGLNEGKIKLPIHKTFVEADNCPTCAGRGQASCNICSGRGQAPCSKCGGSAFSPCMMCRGTGRVQTPGGANDLCTYCKGQGRMACDLCRAQGFIACTNCGTSGTVQCKSCNATGKIARISDVAFYLEPSFQMTQQKLPPNLSEKLEKTSDIQALTAQKFFDVKPVPFEETEKLVKERLLPAPRSGNFMQIGYRAYCPYADLTLSLAGKKNFRISIFGYKSEVLKSQPFLDMLLKKPLMILQRAGQGGAQTSSLLAKASKWKTVREALTLSVKNAPRKAAHILMKQYPFGLSEKIAKALCYHAHIAIKSVTRAPRYIALAAFALSIAPLLTYLWFSAISPQIKTMLPENIPLLYTQLGSDILFYLILCALHIFSIRAAAFISLKKLYTGLNIEKKNKSFPHAGKTALYVWAVNLIIMALIIFFTIDTKPEYFPL